MLLYAVLVFAIAAIGGLVLASSVLRGKLAPWAISVLHALLGASGLVLLIIVVLQGAAPGRLTAALALLVLAELGGFFLAQFHLRKHVAPKDIVSVHAGVVLDHAMPGTLEQLRAHHHVAERGGPHVPPQPGRWKIRAAVSPTSPRFSAPVSGVSSTTRSGALSPIGKGWSEPSSTLSAPAVSQRKRSARASNSTVSK